MGCLDQTIVIMFKSLYDVSYKINIENRINIIYRKLYKIKEIKKIAKETDIRLCYLILILSFKYIIKQKYSH